MAKLLTQSHSFGRAVNNTSSSGRAPVTAAYARGESPGDCRKVLGVGPGASKREVKAAYRKLALQFHPDVVRGDAEVSFSEVNRAYESLITALDDRAADDHEAESCDSSREEEDDRWVDFVDGLVDGYQPREDFSNYYSNLKLYSKGRKYQYHQGNW